MQRVFYLRVRRWQVFITPENKEGDFLRTYCEVDMWFNFFFRNLIPQNLVEAALKSVSVESPSVENFDISSFHP